MSWKNKFSDSVSTIAFHLTLSKRMVYTPELVASDNIHRSFDENFNHFVPAVKNLIERGLVLHQDFSNETYSDWFEREQARAKHKYYVLTPAGEHVVALLKLAGLIRNISAVSEAA